MKHYHQNNLLKFLFLGETPARFNKMHQMVDQELLPLDIQLESNLSMAITNLHQSTRHYLPQVIVLNVDAPQNAILRFIEQFELLLAPLYSQTLFFLSGDQSSQFFSTLSQRFPFIVGFIENPFERISIEKIVANLLSKIEEKLLPSNHEMA